MENFGQSCLLYRWDLFCEKKNGSYHKICIWELLEYRPLHSARCTSNSSLCLLFFTHFISIQLKITWATNGKEHLNIKFMIWPSFPVHTSDIFKLNCTRIFRKMNRSTIECGFRNRVEWNYSILVCYQIARWLNWIFFSRLKFDWFQNRICLFSNNSSFSHTWLTAIEWLFFFQEKKNVCSSLLNKQIRSQKTLGTWSTIKSYITE